MNTAESVPAAIPECIRNLSKPWQASYMMATQLRAALPDWGFGLPQGKPWPLTFVDPTGHRILVVGAGIVLGEYVAQGRQVLEYRRCVPSKKDPDMPTSMYHPDDRKGWRLVDTSTEFRGANWQTRMICYVVSKVGRTN